MRRTDLLIALGLLIAGQVEAWLVDDGERWVSVACALVATAALALRRRHPAAVGIAVVAALTAKEALGGAEELVVLLIAGVVAISSLGALAPSPRSERALGVLLALSAVAVPLGEHADVGELVFSWLVVIAPWGAGRALRSRGERALMQARLAAVEERARIARELHDMVGHNVSLMVLQAGAAEQVVRDRPDQAAEALASIRATGRETIDDLRRLLGLLREGLDEGELAPPPAVGDLAGLVAGLRDAGRPVTLEVEGEPVEVPDGVGLTAYRIVQEALTNVVKHAGGAPARVRVAYGPDALVLEVADEGPGTGRGNPAGHGLVGMRERVALYGGSVAAGPLPGGGFQVRAALPLEAR